MRSPDRADEMTTPLWCDAISAGLADDLTNPAPALSFDLRSLISIDDPDPVDCANMSGSNFSCRETILIRRY